MPEFYRNLADSGRLSGDFSGIRPSLLRNLDESPEPEVIARIIMSTKCSFLVKNIHLLDKICHDMAKKKRWNKIINEVWPYYEEPFRAVRE